MSGEKVESTVDGPETEVGVRDFLLQSPYYAEWDRRKAELESRRAAVQSQVEAAQEEERVTLAKWAVLKFNAVNEGSEVPPKPEPRDLRHLDEALHEVWTQIRMHQGEQAGAVVRAFEDDGVLDGLREEEAADLPKFPEAWEAAVVPFLERATERGTLMRKYETAKASLSSTTVGAPRAALVVSKPGPYDLLAAARGGGSLLDPAANLPVDERQVQRDDSGYGMREGGRWGYADNDRPPPPPVPAWMQRGVAL